MKGFIQTILIIGLLVFGIWWMKKDDSGFSSAPSASKLSIAEKMQWAKKYLSEFQQKGETFFAQLQTQGKDPREVAKEVGKYNDIISAYVKRINKLELPCPQSGTTRSDPSLASYMRWTKQFEQKDKKVMQDFSKRIEQVMTQAGFHR